MERFRRRARRLVLAGLLPAVVLTLDIPTWSAARSGFGPFPGPTTQAVDRSDRRFDVLVQRRPERLGWAGERLSPPDGRPRLTAARAFAIAGGERQPHGAKPSVRLATFTDPDFPTPSAPGTGSSLARCGRWSGWWSCPTYLWWSTARTSGRTPAPGAGRQPAPPGPRSTR